MLGLKIISESKYLSMKNVYDTYKEYSEEKETDIKKMQSDLDSLRQQLNDKIRTLHVLNEKYSNLQHEVKSLREFKRDTLEAMGQIDLAGFRLSYCTKKCKHCNDEQHDCRKYEFGRHQYCVIPK